MQINELEQAVLDRITSHPELVLREFMRQVPLEVENPEVLRTRTLKLLDEYVGLKKQKHRAKKQLEWMLANLNFENLDRSDHLEAYIRKLEDNITHARAMYYDTRSRAESFGIRYFGR